MQCEVLRADKDPKNNKGDTQCKNKVYVSHMVVFSVDEICPMQNQTSTQANAYQLNISKPGHHHFGLRVEVDVDAESSRMSRLEGSLANVSG